MSLNNSIINNNLPEFDYANLYNNMYDMSIQDVYAMNRNRNYNPGHYNNSYDNRYNYNYNNYNRGYYPGCDSYGRCGNPMWWLFWPFFFL